MERLDHCCAQRVSLCSLQEDCRGDVSIVELPELLAQMGPCKWYLWQRVGDNVVQVASWLPYLEEHPSYAPWRGPEVLFNIPCMQT